MFNKILAHCSRRYSRRNAQGSGKGICNVSIDHLAGRSGPSASISGSWHQGVAPVSGRCAIALHLCSGRPGGAEQAVPGKNSFYPSSAGFRVQVANNPAGQKALRTLPAHRFVVNGVGDAVRYFYAEPQHCVCIFVGTQQAYDSCRKILSQPLKPTDNVPPDYKTQAGVLLSGQPLRQSARGDPTTLSDYLSTLY
jgi:hypothetical protein